MFFAYMQTCQEQFEEMSQVTCKKVSHLLAIICIPVCSTTKNVHSVQTLQWRAIGGVTALGWATSKHARCYIFFPISSKQVVPFIKAIPIPVDQYFKVSINMKTWVHIQPTLFSLCSCILQLNCFLLREIARNYVPSIPYKIIGVSDYF
jgi:hypothetical protein